MLSKFSIKKPFTVFVMVVLIIVFGYVSFTKMTPDLFPSIDLPYVVVMTSYFGATPEEVESTVTKPMEQQMATLANLESIRSVSAENYSTIILQFKNDTNLDTISVDIRDKIDLVAGQWSETVGKPIVLKLNPDMMPIAVAAVTQKGSSNAETSDFLNKELLRRLEGTDGVASVSTSGMVENTIQVDLNQDKIDRMNQKVQSALIKKFGGAYGTVSSGLQQAKSQQAALSSGKQQIIDAQIGLAQQFDSVRIMLLMKSTELAANLAENPSAANELLPQIQAIATGLMSLDNQKDLAYTKLSNSMSEVVAAQAMLQVTVMQLESSLAEVESARDAAVSSANLTGMLTMQNVSAIIAAQNLDMPAGYVQDGNRELLVSVGDKFDNIDEIRNLPVLDLGIEGLDPILLSDVADVEDFNNAGETYAKINGEDGVLLTFQKQSNYATTKVANNIQEKFSELEGQYEGLKFTTLSDQGKYIYIVINSVLDNLWIGALLAILVLIFFLRDIRPTLITALSIPISLTFAIVLMYFTGITLNVISLAGLAVGVGMLVDNSIVVIENIFRLRGLGLSKIQAASSGVAQMSGAITASTLTTVCVFLPLVFVEGITKQIFTDMALTVTYSLMASLLVALTLVPALGRSLLVKTGENSVLNSKSRTLAKYKQMVAFSVRHKVWVLCVSVLLLLLTSGLSYMKGFEYMPSMASPEISATIEFPGDNTLKETAKATDAISEELSSMKGVDTVSVMLASDSGMFGMGGNTTDFSQVSVYLLLDEAQVNQNPVIADKIKTLAEKYDGKAQVFGGTDISSSDALGGGGISISVYSDNLDNLRTSAQTIEKALAKVDGVDEVSDSTEGTVPELRITVDKEKAAANGLTVAQVYGQIANLLTEKKTSTTIEYLGNDRDVVVTAKETRELNAKSIKGLKLSTTNAMTGQTGTVKLTEVATIAEDQSLKSITHHEQNREISVSATILEDENITLVTNLAKDKVAKLDLPAGVTYEFEGEDKAIMDAMGQLMLMMALGLLLIYLVMVAQFQSLRAPFIVMLTVPLAFTGGLIALLVSGKEISVVSMIGFIMLMGVIVNNAIVLIDTMNRLRVDGMDKREAIIEAGAARLRPVLMTAVTTVLALIPMALGFGTGAELIQPVALVCVGGLAYGTFMTLLVIPALYDWLGAKKITVISEEELTVRDL
jgi:HAE1 family hydrophobic/amphiphilic exporter-1